ncbi:DUF456 domain-containing protein [Alkaliphilus hydrothermalis]|uniref:Uncharacterized protein YqgC (DUF456 family) n=1 Tax=Alkaliphilus hydrothermalis TaxID=1482730 RepID=A0ABS2NNN1_9FIRM|nr:DUF456 domain-containing protein [Alkaliphilus hydrothermalis]MBM7614432.1 uncharacterized protein YqgC (DUF456 family) [Alkaliphilus hydrothermalis]
MNYYLFFSVILIILGIIGIFVAFLPGPILVLAGIVLYGWSTSFTVISLKVIVLFGLLTLGGILFDYLASFISAKKFNVSKTGTWGLIIGGIVGFLLLNLIGLVVGQFLGIMAGEILSGKNLKSSIKSGTASLVGYVLSIIVNVIIVTIMMGYFSLVVLT